MKLSGFLNKARPARAAEARRLPQAPPGIRLYAVGDIHGQIELLDKLHAAIAEDGQKGNPLQRIIVYLGDYVDRGLHSREVVSRLLEGPLPGFRAVHIKGNHEQAVLDFLEDPSFGPQWAKFGGLETLYSYGVEDAAQLSKPEQFFKAADLFFDHLPAAHLRFFKALPTNLTVGDYYFCHAGVKPGVPLGKQAEEDLLWIRDEFLESKADFGKIVVHGHSPEPEPVLRPNRVGVDTGAYMTGVLTCVVIEGAALRFLQAGH
jgi:diadenosine tetraphosphatase ApaH/serine/threonine PP2A family protein phosphatase